MWLSLYLYHGDDPYGPELDRLLVDAVAPVAAQLEAERSIARFFFVRYGDPRCHLRLRLQLESEERAEAIRARVRAAAPLEVQRVDYVPEWRRYGGTHGVPSQIWISPPLATAR